MTDTNKHLFKSMITIPLDQVYELGSFQSAKFLYGDFSFAEETPEFENGEAALRWLEEKLDDGR